MNPLGVGDVVQCTRLAWDLYHNCYLVAKAAPEEFRRLVTELAALQGVLRTLRDDVNSDSSFLDRLSEERQQTLERCLASSYDTLKRLEDLVLKYRSLGIDRDGLQFWRRIRWSTQQANISDLRARIMVHTCNLSLCMSSMGKYVSPIPFDGGIAKTVRADQLLQFVPKSTGKFDGDGLKATGR